MPKRAKLSESFLKESIESKKARILKQAEKDALDDQEEIRQVELKLVEQEGQNKLAAHRKSELLNRKEWNKAKALQEELLIGNKSLLDKARSLLKTQQEEWGDIVLNQSVASVGDDKLQSHEECIGRALHLWRGFLSHPH